MGPTRNDLKLKRVRTGTQETTGKEILRVSTGHTQCNKGISDTTKKKERKRAAFSDISKRNNDYSETFSFERGQMGVVLSFVSEIPDYESTMLLVVMDDTSIARWKQSMVLELSIYYGSFPTIDNF